MTFKALKSPFKINNNKKKKALLWLTAEKMFSSFLNVHTLINAHLVHPALSVNTPAPCLEKPADIMSEQEASYKQNLTQRMNTFLCSETKQGVFKAKRWREKMCQ